VPGVSEVNGDRDGVNGDIERPEFSAVIIATAADFPAI